MLHSLFIFLLLLYVIAHHSDNSSTNTRYNSQSGQQRHPGHEGIDSSHRYPDIYEDAETCVVIDYADNYEDTSAACDSDNYQNVPDSVRNWSGSSLPNVDNPKSYPTV